MNEEVTVTIKDFKDCEEYWGASFTCPVCKVKDIFTWHKFCHGCGRLINWDLNKEDMNNILC